MYNQAGHSKVGWLRDSGIEAKEKHICTFNLGKLEGFLKDFDKYFPKWLSLSGGSRGVCIWWRYNKDAGLANSDFCLSMDNKEISE